MRTLVRVVDGNVQAFSPRALPRRQMLPLAHRFDGQPRRLERGVASLAPEIAAWDYDGRSDRMDDDPMGTTSSPSIPAKSPGLAV